MSDKSNLPILGRYKEELRNLNAGSFIGEACALDGDCRPGLVCLQAYGDHAGAYPDGYCSAPCPKHTCIDDSDYMYSRCVDWEHEDQPVCMISCGAEGLCRPGYFCNRLERSDGGEGVRYVCTPRELSATTALARLRDENDGRIPPSPLRNDATEPPGSNENDARIPPSSRQNEAPESPEDNAPETNLNQTTETPESGSTLQPDDHQEAFPWGPTIGALVVLLALLTTVRFIFGQRQTVIDRFLRRNDDSTALEAVRKNEEKEHKRSDTPTAAPEVRKSGTRPATRPLRAQLSPQAENDVSTHSAGTTRIIQRDQAEEGAPPTEDADSTATAADYAPPHHAPESPDNDAPESPDNDHEASASAPPLEVEDQGDHTHRAAEQKDGAIARRTLSQSTPRRPADWLEPPNDDEPLMDVGRPLAARVWSGARTLQSSTMRNERIVNRVPVWDNIDDFAPPQPFEVVVQLIDELRRHAEELRKRKGYDQIVYIESDASRTWFRRASDGSITINHPPDSFAKPSMAPDVMRRRGFEPGSTPVADAHTLSLIHLGRYLLGCAEANAFIPSLQALETLSNRFTHEESLLEEMVVEGLSSVQIISRAGQSRPQNTAFNTTEPTRVSNVHAPNERSGQDATDDLIAELHSDQTPTRPAEQEPPVPPVERSARARPRRLMCPRCAGDVLEGELACGHCGQPLEPVATACASCGEMNLRVAGEEEQTCIAPQCGAPLQERTDGADPTHPQLSTLFTELGSFEDLRRVQATRDEVLYQATSNGKQVDIWQLPLEPWQPIQEAQREQYGLSPRFALPMSVRDGAGARFALYDHIDVTIGIDELNVEELAVELLSLLIETHDARARLPALTPDDLFVNDDRELCLRNGHRLRGQTTPVPLALPESFAAPELQQQVVGTIASDLYTVAKIWQRWSHDTFAQDPELRQQHRQVVELMRACLQDNPAERPASPSAILTRIRSQRRLSDLV